ncbi:MAG: hypothetical protein EBR09_01715 [Proteobacteria bacterium]|nr:hypothetical protein [Pseudomonadota bacterium]
MSVNCRKISIALQAVVLFAQLLAGAQTAHAYPVLLNSLQLSQILGTPRNQMIAISSDGKKTQRVALQIDEVEDDAALVLRQPFEIRKLRESLAHPQKNDPFFGRLNKVHRAVLDDRDFAACDDACQANLPAQIKTVCGNNSAQILLKIALANQSSAFIADCNTPVSELSSRTVTYNASEKTISTQKYDYVYTSDKNIFFREIKTKPDGQPVLSKSELKAYLKPKYLFNMKFEDDDLISQITSLSRGPQGLNIEVAVALNILAMKINTQICCDVSFYEDALYFPVMLDLPFSGDAFANGSGLFFGFRTENGTNVKTEFISGQTKGASDVILIQQGKNLIALGFRSPNKKESAQVRPKVVSQVEMNSLKFTPVESPAGIFYDIRNARQGFQHFMVWMLFGQESERAKLIEYAQYGAQVRVEKFTSPSGR